MPTIKAASFNFPLASTAPFRRFPRKKKIRLLNFSHVVRGIIPIGPFADPDKPGMGRPLLPEKMESGASFLLLFRLSETRHMRELTGARIVVNMLRAYGEDISDPVLKLSRLSSKV
jgi:hypothetical protein